ncbi:MAG TPA: MarR family winged helix-turn-helix transcriptional regulator [Candidatus Binataceae bacterium]|nr:MarR family winged helix-turn-helix transcriptional regulator [Candidatus Binataceae bacterium]
MSVNAVIAQTTMDKVRVSRAVAKLLNAGLITRDADPQDHRRAILDLTATGRAMFEEIVPLVQDAEAEMMAALSEAEHVTLGGR